MPKSSYADYRINSRKRSGLIVLGNFLGHPQNMQAAFLKREARISPAGYWNQNRWSSAKAAAVPIAIVTPDCVCRPPTAA